MPMPKIPVSAALSKSQFETQLRSWFEESSEERIGQSNGYGGAPWIWVRHGSGVYHLNADTKRAGVEDYLMLAQSEADVQWVVTTGRAGKMTKVTFGRRMVAIPGFYFYRKG